MSIYESLNPVQQEAVYHTEVTASYSGRGRVRQDQSADPQDCLSD